MPDRILGVCYGYDAAQVEPFLRSLARTGFAGQAVLFAGGLPPGAAERLAALGARLVPVAVPDAPETYSPNVVRYRLFLDWLETAPDTDRVLLVDVRDVLFQADPFSQDLGGGLHSFLESDRLTIGDCVWTSAWIKYRYDQEKWEKLRGERIVCSGATMGGLPDILDYLRRMAGELEPWLPGRNYMAGHDQGAHNVLAHEGRLPGLRLWPQAHGPVLHLGQVAEADIRLDDRGRVLNTAGRPVPVVHQYDRHPALAARLLAALAARPL